MDIEVEQKITSNSGVWPKLIFGNDRPMCWYKKVLAAVSRGTRGWWKRLTSNHLNWPGSILFPPTGVPFFASGSWKARANVVRLGLILTNERSRSSKLWNFEDDDFEAWNLPIQSGAPFQLSAAKSLQGCRKIKRLGSHFPGGGRPTDLERVSPLSSQAKHACSLSESLKK